MNSTERAYRVSRIASKLIFAWTSISLIAVGGCSDGEQVFGQKQTPLELQELGAALTQTGSVSFKLPANVAVQNVTVGATDALTIGDRVRIEGTATVSKASTGKIQSGTWTKLRGLVSGGQVVLDENDEVNGDIRSGAALTKPKSANVLGSVVENTPLGPNKTISWAYAWDSTSQGNVIVNANQRQVLAPGTYGSLTMNSQGELRLRTGAYVFGNIVVNSASKLVIDDASGPVQIYASGTFNYQGSIIGATSGLPRLVVGLTTTTATTISAPFTGILIAPNAPLSLQAAAPQGHRAVFYGKTVTIQPDVVVRNYPFDWSTLIPTTLPPIDSNAAVHKMPRSLLDEPINANRFGSGSGEQTPGDNTRAIDSPTPITFRLPERRHIEGGNLGNGTVVFTFRNGGGSAVTCTFRGGGGTAAPGTVEELNGGRYMNFESCSNGSVAGSTHTATHFEMTVNPAPGYPVTVTAPVTQDGACSDSLELFSVEETKQLRQSFNWVNASKVAENNPDGKPALYYAYVYLSNTNDAINLRKLRIHALNRPFFETELTRFDGKCGALTNPGDGDGIFVHALIPGAVYNKLIDARTAPNLSGNREIFEAVIIRQPPAAARNANSSVRYDVLAQARFRYLSYESRPLAATSTITRYADADPISALVDVIDYVGQGVDAIVDGIERGLGAIALAFSDSVVVTFNVRGVVPDDAFASPVMVRGWGPLANQPLAAPGLKVTLIQKFAGPIPMSFEARTNMVGSASIEAVKQSGNARLCIELQNDAALVTDFLWAKEVCDLRNPADPTNVLTHLNDFDGKQVNADVSDSGLVGLYQADDSFRWVRDTTGFASRRGTIMTGFYANSFSPDQEDGSKRIYAPCLGYTAIGSEFIGGTLAAGGFLGFLANGAGTPLGPVIQAVTLVATTLEAVLARTDVMMPSVSTIRSSRVVMSHESGHFLFCGMLNQQNPLAVERLIWTNMLNLEDQSAPYGYLNEAVADLIAGQVAGGARYPWLAVKPGRVGSGSGGAFCNGNGSCFDENQNATSSAKDDPQSIGRIATMLFDAFDGHSVTKFVAGPNNADSWQSTPPGVTPSGLVFSPTSYGSQDSAIEGVQLSGPRLVDFASGIAQTMAQLPTAALITDNDIYGSLNQAMVKDGVVSWCDRCRVLGLHSSQRGPNDSDIGGLFHTCTVDPVVSQALGSVAPQPDGRIDSATCLACPAGHISNASGACVPCAGTVVGNSCMTCSIDAVIDGTTQDKATLDPSIATPNDICPTVFWVRIDNPSAIIGRGAASLRASATPLSVFTSSAPDGVLGSFSESQCERTYELNRGHMDATGPVIDTGVTTTGVFSPCSPDNTVCLNGCSPLPTFTFSGTDVASNQSLFFAMPADPNGRFRFTSHTVSNDER